MISARKSLPIAPRAAPGARRLPLFEEARPVDRQTRPIYAVWEVTEDLVMDTPVYGAPTTMDAGSNTQDAKADTKGVTNPDTPVYGAPAPPADAASCTTDAGGTACAPADAAPDAPLPAPVYGAPAPR
ncbi:MAG: hypothetical protein SF187_12085 [Deltaproteobacteria bacterium]|nr:hypothetical protein [Deltaproteobacteria bacterium]